MDTLAVQELTVMLGNKGGVIIMNEQGGTLGAILLSHVRRFDGHFRLVMSNRCDRPTIGNEHVKRPLCGTCETRITSRHIVGRTTLQHEQNDGHFAELALPFRIGERPLLSSKFHSLFLPLINADMRLRPIGFSPPTA